MKTFRLLIPLLLLMLTACGQNNDATPSHLLCEFNPAPLGIDETTLRFNWIIETSEEGFVQKAYEINIATSPEKLLAGEADVYSSGKVVSTDMAMKASLTALSSYTRYYWEVKIWDNWGRPCPVSKTAWFETAKLRGAEGWKASWITDHNDMEHRPAPLFRTEVQLKEKPVSARAYVSGLGYCTFFVNSHKVGKGSLDPGYTDYSKRVLYLTYDVTNQLQAGKNCFAAELGNGWFNNQTPTVWKYNLAPWRARPQMMAEIHVTYADGSKETFLTDSSWKTSTGPLLYDNLYVGSTYDARLEQSGWNGVGFDDSKWADVKCVQSPATLIQSQLMEEVGEARTFKPAEIKEVAKNTYLLTMGENTAGVLKLRAKGAKGTVVTIRHGELLDEAGRLTLININMHLRPERKEEAEVQRDIYIMKGEGVEEFIAPYTYHGYQYAEITSSAPIELDENGIEGVVLHSLVDLTGNFRCSDELLNTIYDNCKRSYLANLFGIPTDCPHREKNGWMADGYMVQEAGMLNYNSRNIYEKWVLDMVDGQQPNGNVWGVVPASWHWDSNWAGPLWDAAIFIVPELLYDYYGDTKSIEEIYPVAQRYLAFLDTCRNEKGLLHKGLGDWLYYKAITPVDFMATLFYYKDCIQMARMSRLLGKGEEQKYLDKAEELKQIVNDNFLDSQNACYANKTQLSYALPLYMDIVPEELKVKVAANLAQAIKDNDYSLDFGFIGSMVVPEVMSKYGYNDEMYKLYTKTTMPSYGHWVKEWKATSLFETWDITRRIGDASLNHPSMGAVSAWMMKSIAGIQLGEGTVGFKTITIKPTFIDELDFAEATVETVRGVVSSSWKRSNGAVELTVTIPGNTRATVVLPSEEKEIGSGVHTYTVK